MPTAAYTCPGCGLHGVCGVVERDTQYDLVRCAECALEFSVPMSNPGGDWYDKAYWIRHSAIDSRIREYYRWALSELPGKGKLLDIGCGEGVFVAFARSRGFDAYGVDFSREAIELGKRWYGLETIFHSSLVDLRELGQLADVDIITLFEVLEHLEDPSGLVQEIMSFLRPGGYLVASVPFRDRWPLRDFGDYPPNHLTRWNEASLRTFFERHGFRGIHISVGSRLHSYHQFLGYLVRMMIYALFGMHAKGFNGVQLGKGGRLFSKTWSKRFLSFLRPRQCKDIMLWPAALVTFPFIFPWFRGSNLMLIARKPEHRKGTG